jgi:hypothetical protein
MLAVAIVVLAGGVADGFAQTRQPQNQRDWSTPRPRSTAPKALKPCVRYGEGFYYVPGTDTCVKFGGYVRSDISVGNRR